MQQESGGGSAAAVTAYLLPSLHLHHPFLPLLLSISIIPSSHCFSILGSLSTLSLHSPFSILPSFPFSCFLPSSDQHRHPSPVIRTFSLLHTLSCHLLFFFLLLFIHVLFFLSLSSLFQTQRHEERMGERRIEFSLF